MKIVKYNIANYRAITNLELKLNYQINPVIGINESGKTTLLNAILAFDKHRDKVNSGRHLEYQNKYSTRQSLDCKITGHITLSEKELEELLRAAKVKAGSDDHQTLCSLTSSDQLSLTRILSEDNQQYQLENIKLDQKTKDNLTKFLLDRLPYILYFDDFTDRVPDEIAFNRDFESSGKLTNSRIREWQEIIIEIFKRSDAEGIHDSDEPFRKFLKLDDQDRKGDILSDIQDVLNEEVIQEWKRIKKSGSTTLADDSENLSIELKCIGTIFSFKIKDKSNDDKKRTFNVSDRSKGFQWFFNYMVKLKFNPRYKKTQENSIFLLDEPGSYLHSSAQSELLQELSKVSKKNTIIYCTHSQYLLNPKTIKLGSIKIVEKQKSTISVSEYGNYKSKDNKGALSAIYQALQLNFTRDFLGKIIITEGMTDFYFLSMLRQHTSLFESSNFNIIPGMGASNSTVLISVAISFSDNFIVLLDNDKAGKEAEKRYKEEFGEEIRKHIHFYSSSNGFELEDFFSKNDKDRLSKITSANSIKKALPLLFHDYQSHHSDFWTSLDSTTISNLEPITDIINRTFLD